MVSSQADYEFTNASYVSNLPQAIFSSGESGELNPDEPPRPNTMATTIPVQLEPYPTKSGTSLRMLREHQ